MSYDLIKFQTKSMLSVLTSQFAVFALDNSTEDEVALKKSTSALSDLIHIVHKVLLESPLNLDGDELTIRRGALSAKEYKEQRLKPIVLTGSSPFAPFVERKKISSVLISLQSKSVKYCDKAISKLARGRFERSLLDDAPVSMKEAKRSVIDDLKNEIAHVLDKVPLVEKYVEHFFVIDFKHQVVLANNTHHNREAVNVFFALLLKMVKKLEELHPELQPNLEALSSEVFRERLDIQPYSTHSLSKQKAFGAYSIPDALDFYSSDEFSKSGDKLPVSPTDTVKFASEKDEKTRVDFRNSIGYFVNPDKSPLPSFKLLSDFSKKHRLKASSLIVEGQIPRSSQLVRFVEAHADVAPDELKEPMLCLSFETKAVDGNVSFKVKGGMSWFEEAARQLLLDKIDDTHVGRRQLESFLLLELGDMLEPLHYVISLFTEFYLMSNQAKGDLTVPLVEDLKKASEEAA